MNSQIVLFSLSVFVFFFACRNSEISAKQKVAPVSAWEEEWGRLEKTDLPYKEGTRFIYTKFNFCPKVNSISRYRISLTLVNINSPGYGCVVEELDLDTGKKKKSYLPFPPKHFHIPASELKDSRSSDPNLNDLTTHLGTFRTVKKIHQTGQLRHYANDTNCESHYPEKHLWYAPNIPFPILVWERDKGSVDLDKPPVNQYSLPHDSFYGWEILEAVEP